MIGSFLSSIGGQMCNWCHYQKSFAYLSCKTTNWSHIAVGLYSSRSQKVSKCDKHISDTLSCVLWATFFATLGKINTTQQLLCIQIPCILVQDNHNEWQMRIYLATIWSYCFFHSLKCFAKTNSAKTAKKNCRQCSSNAHGVEKLRPKYLVSGTINCM